MMFGENVKWPFHSWTVFIDTLNPVDRENQVASAHEQAAHRNLWWDAGCGHSRIAHADAPPA